MHIVETLLLPESAKLLRDLLKDVPFRLITETPFPVYRLEIDPEMVILLHVLLPGANIPEAFIEDISHHIRSLIFLRDDSDRPESGDYLSEMEARFTELRPQPAFVLAKQVPTELLEKTADYLKKNGHYLGPKSRMTLWNPDNRESVLRVWRTAWGPLLLDV